MENWKNRSIVWLLEAAIGGTVFIMFPKNPILIIWSVFIILSLIILLMPVTRIIEHLYDPKSKPPTKPNPYKQLEKALLKNGWKVRMEKKRLWFWHKDFWKFPE